MKRHLLLTLPLVAATALMAADAKEQAKAAAKKLCDQPNYSWTTTTKIEGSQFTPGPMQGKVEKDGFMCISQEMQNNTLEAVKKGTKGVLKTDQGWQTTEELQQAAQGGGGGRGRFGGRMLTTMKAPGEELIDILGKTGELKEAEGAICGNLTEEGAKERLAFGRGRRGGGADAPPGPKNAKGSIKVWTKDGMVCKYELTVSGTITVGQDQTERDINRTSTVEIKEVGKTKVTVPDEAKKKLGA